MVTVNLRDFPVVACDTCGVGVVDSDSSILHLSWATPRSMECLSALPALAFYRTAPRKLSKWWR